MSCERLKNIQTEIKALLDNPNAKNEDYKKFYAKYGIPYSNKVEVEIQNNCGVINAQIAENIIEVPKECVESTKKLCLIMDKEGPGSWKYEQCMRKYGPVIKNIYQSNISNITTTCATNTIFHFRKKRCNRLNQRFLILRKWERGWGVSKAEIRSIGLIKV
jgi:hypothetical protein